MLLVGGTMNMRCGKGIPAVHVDVDLLAFPQLEGLGESKEPSLLGGGPFRQSLCPHVWQPPPPLLLSFQETAPISKPSGLSDL